MANVKVLVEGYYGRDDQGDEKVRPTISLVRDRNIVMVVDPGIVEDYKVIIEALTKEDLTVNDVNYVCLTNARINHCKNAGLFPKAKILEYFGVWNGIAIEDWNEQFSDNIQVLKTPGHSDANITLFVKTDDGVVAICGDVFWKENYPEVDPYASDLKKLEQSRHLVLAHSHWIVPGHAGMYKTSNGWRLEHIKAGKKVKPVMLGSCRKCKRKFLKFSDKCPCQEWLCYRCCECERDCEVCSCKVKARK